MEHKQAGKGCLPYFIFVIILFFIRFQFAPGKPWERDFTNIVIALYWIGVAYMLLVVIINKINEAESKIKHNTTKSTNNIEAQNRIQPPKEINRKNEDDTKRENKEIKLLHRSWIDHNEKKVFKNCTLLDLLDDNSINSITYSMLLNSFEWKYKRFRILVRDKFECQDCHEKSNQLHVHHLYYIKDTMPWEIDEKALISLCKNCHAKRHEKENIKVYKNYNGQLIVTGIHYLICPRCNGSGYLPQFKHVENGVCFLCFGNVLSETIFSHRLNTINSNREKYNLMEMKTSLKNFMSSISIEYYSKHINEKLFNEFDSFFLNEGSSIDDSLDDLPF
jgi:hypothetical protein